MKTLLTPGLGALLVASSMLFSDAAHAGRYTGYYCVAWPNYSSRSRHPGYGHARTKAEAAAKAVRNCHYSNHSERYCRISYCMPEQAR